MAKTFGLEFASKRHSPFTTCNVFISPYYSRRLLIGSRWQPRAHYDMNILNLRNEYGCACPVFKWAPTHQQPPDDVTKWKHFPRNWPFVRGIHRSPVNSPHKGQWRGTLMFSVICVWINDWVNNREAGDLRRQRGHYDVIVMEISVFIFKIHKISSFCLCGCCQIESAFRKIRFLKTVYLRNLL